MTFQGKRIAGQNACRKHDELRRNKYRIAHSHYQKNVEARVHQLLVTADHLTMLRTLLNSTLTKRNTKLRNMPIKEDSILEALCEKSSIEPQTRIRGKRGISVTKKERKRIFNQLASQSDIGQ